MDARLAIDALRHSIDLITHINDMWVVRNDRVVVQRDDEAVIVFKRLLDVIQRVVALHGIGLGGHFHMGARKLPTRAIVVNHEVMRAQDTWIGHDLRADVGNELRIGSLSEKRVDRVANELDAAPTDIQADRESDPRIELDARHISDDGTRKHRARGDNVVLGILGRGKKRLGFYALAEHAVEMRHPKLNRHGPREDHHQSERELDWTWIQHLID